MILKSRSAFKTAIRRLGIFHFDNNKEYSARKLVGFSNEEMYNVVADVKNYKHFVPFCKKSTVLVQTNKDMKANLVIGFPPITENYTSHVSLIKPSLVSAVCRDGRLFDYLETTWKFSPGLESIKKSCIVEFYIKFQFKSALHSQLATMFFERLVKEMESAFFKEAKRRYGPESLPSHPLGLKS